MRARRWQRGQEAVPILCVPLGVRVSLPSVATGAESTRGMLGGLKVRHHQQLHVCEMNDGHCCARVLALFRLVRADVLDFFRLAHTCRIAMWFGKVLHIQAHFIQRTVAKACIFSHAASLDDSPSIRTRISPLPKL